MKKLEALFSEENLITFAMYFLAAGLALVFFPALYAKVKGWFSKAPATTTGA